MASKRILRELAARRVRPDSECIVPGATALEEVIKAGRRPSLVCCAPSGRETGDRILSTNGVDAPVLPIDAPSAARIIGVDTIAHGIFCSVAVPSSDLSLLPSRRLLVLDGLGDPGNVGTLVRTADALGWDAVFACRPCVSLVNDKVLRSAAGALFRIPWQMGTWAELDALLGATRRTLLADVAGGIAVHDVPIADEPLALVLSSEAHGPSPDALARLSASRVCIPMRPGRDSLNVAVAGGILMHGLGGAR